MKNADPPQSRAATNLEANLKDITAFIKQLTPDRLQELVKLSSESVQQMLESRNGTKLTDQIAALSKRIKELNEAIDQYAAFRVPALKMICVMLVSYLEAYFEDILVDLARRNPGVVKDPSLDTKRLMEVESIEELRSEVLGGWAKASVRAGGPRNWCKRLNSMGAKSLDPAAVDVIQQLYDIRNLIVHDRGTISHAHARAYSKSGAVAGQKVKVTSQDMESWLPAIVKLVNGIERFSQAYAKGKGS